MVTATRARTDSQAASTRVLTDRQAARRRRVVLAALELGAIGGYDGVQMRDVASRAGVALGTVYHYFSSKDHLLSAALVEWTSEIENQVRSAPPRGSTNLDRVLDLLRRTTAPMAADESLSAAMIGGLMSDGPEVAACHRDLRAIFSRLLGSGFDQSVSSQERRRVIRTLEHVWFSGLIGWRNDWMSIEQAIAELESAAGLLLTGRNGT